MHVPAPPDFPFPSLHFLPPILVSVLLFFGSFFFFLLPSRSSLLPLFLGAIAGQVDWLPARKAVGKGGGGHAGQTLKTH